MRTMAPKEAWVWLFATAAFCAFLSLFLACLGVVLVAKEMLNGSFLAAAFSTAFVGLFGFEVVCWTKIVILLLRKQP